MHFHPSLRAALIAGFAFIPAAAAPALAVDKPPFMPFEAFPTIPMTLPVAGSIFDILVQSWLTKGQYSMVLIKDVPGGGPMPMIHTKETESFYVLEGHYQFIVDGKTYEEDPGHIVVAPPNALRSFKVTGDKPGSLLAIYTPGGFENVFLEWYRGGLDTPEKIQALEAQYGIVGSGVAP